MNWTTEVPTPDAYVALRLAAGLAPRSVAAASRGLAQTLHAVALSDGAG